VALSEEHWTREQAMDVAMVLGAICEVVMVRTGTPRPDLIAQLETFATEYGGRAHVAESMFLVQLLAQILRRSAPSMPTR
jgi:hypothetical protein